MSIQIVTVVDDRCASSGERVAREWATGPINLMRAVRALPEVRERARLSYGNIGHVGSWIAVDGVRLRAEDDGSLADGPKTMADARRLLVEIASGQLESRYRANDESAADLAAAERDAMDLAREVDGLNDDRALSAASALRLLADTADTARGNLAAFLCRRSLDPDDIRERIAAVEKAIAQRNG